jgi:hypothetical protein
MRKQLRQVKRRTETEKMFGLVVLSLILAISVATDIPTQIHIAFAGRSSNGDPSTMAVSWNTKKQTLTSTVKYGIQSKQYAEVATGFSSSYYESFNHHVVLNTLTPGSTYYYIVGDDKEGWSEEFTFVSTKPNSELHGNFSFFIFGDLGLTNGDPTNTYINANKENVDLIWHAGDVSYADDSFLHPDCVFKFCYEETFDSYMELIKPWASKLPVMTTPGKNVISLCSFLILSSSS